MKKRILYIILGPALILFGASCSKQAEQSAAQGPAIASPAAPEQKTSRPKASEMPALTPQNVFSLARAGEKATIDIKVDFSPCRAIEILRNTTGVTSSRNTVARFAPDVQKYVDTLPDAKAYWYWVKVQYPDKPTQYYGPMRVDPDGSNSGKYATEDPAARYPWKVTRTQATATISWDFPPGVSTVVIRRNSSKAAKNRPLICISRELKDTHVDTFPDSEADYWYWIEARLQNGASINQGPVKAEFSENQ